MNKETAIKTAAKWWTDKLRQRAPHDNGDRSCGLAMLFADMLTTPMSEDQLNKFQEALEKEIAKEMERYGQITLGCDYVPCNVLRNAAVQAGINTNNFPFKTSMSIRLTREVRRNSEDGFVVSVYDGYAQPRVEIKPCE